MGIKKFIIFILLAFPALATNWMEDSLSLSFDYPRGWVKHITRSENFLIVDLLKNNNARITIDSYRRNDSLDLDRYAEYRIDLFLKSHPDLKILTEKKLGSSRGFDDVIFIVINYEEEGKTISNRILFAKKANLYHSVQCKTWKELFKVYKDEFNLVTRSFQFLKYDPDRWRNDSIFYLDPDKNLETIRQIKSAAPLHPETNKETRAIRPEPKMKEPVPVDARK